MSGEPFLFDEHIFDDDALAKLSDAEREAMPEFTREEMANAQKKSYQEGMTAGKKEAIDSIHQKTLQVLEKLQRDISVLFAAEQDRNKDYENDAVTLSYHMFQKVLPTLMAQHGEQELKNKLASTLQQHSIPETITIEMNPDIKQNLESFIAEKGQELQKSISMHSSSNLDILACKISWAGGGILINHSDVLEKTTSMILETLAENNINVHDSVDNIIPPASENDSQIGESSDE